jgi:hypothetical protein
LLISFSIRPVAPWGYRYFWWVSYENNDVDIIYTLSFDTFWRLGSILARHIIARNMRWNSASPVS